MKALLRRLPGDISHCCPHSRLKHTNIQDLQTGLSTSRLSYLYSPFLTHVLWQEILVEESIYSKTCYWLPPPHKPPFTNISSSYSSSTSRNTWNVIFRQRQLGGKWRLRVCLVTDAWRCWVLIVLHVKLYHNCQLLLCRARLGPPGSFHSQGSSSWAPSRP